MKVYHGSDVEVKNVDLAHSQMYKDFGPGFYVSVDKKQARHFAKYKADRPASKTHKAIVSVFDFDERALTDGSLRVKKFEGYSTEWVDFIHEYRHTSETDYDLIIGPIANDDVRTQYARYDMGEITKEELLESLKYKRVTFQYCFKTIKAVSFLKSTDK